MQNLQNKRQKSWGNFMKKSLVMLAVAGIATSALLQNTSVANACVKKWIAAKRLDTT